MTIGGLSREAIEQARDKGWSRDEILQWLLLHETADLAHEAYRGWAERTATDIAAALIAPARGLRPRANFLEREMQLPILDLPAEEAWASRLAYVAREYRRARRVEAIEQVDREYVKPYVAAHGWPSATLREFLATAGVPAHLVAAMFA